VPGPERSCRVLLVGTGAYAGATVTALHERGARDIGVYSRTARGPGWPGEAVGAGPPGSGLNWNGRPDSAGPRAGPPESELNPDAREPVSAGWDAAEREENTERRSGTVEGAPEKSMRTGGASDESGRSAGSIIPVSWAAMARTSSVVRRGRQLGTESCGSDSAAGGADGAEEAGEGHG